MGLENKKYLISIDQSLRNSGINVFDTSTSEVIYRKTIEFKENVEDWSDVFKSAVNIIRTILNEIVKDENILDFYIVRENHSMTQFGNGSKNIELAGAIDFFFLSKGFRINYDYFKIFPRVWMKKFSVKKPKRISKSGKTSSLDHKKYIEICPFGKTEHEVDSYFIGKYALEEIVAKK